MTSGARKRRSSLFGKYVLALVGLVLFVLSVNAALETWIIYQQTKANLVGALADKAEAAARRIAQGLGDTQRQIGWVTRASVTTLEERRADYALLMRQLPAVQQVTLIDGEGREQLVVTPQAATIGSGADLSHDPRFTQALAKGTWHAPVTFQNGQPILAIAMAHSGRGAGVSVAQINLAMLPNWVQDGQAGRTGRTVVVDDKGRLIASSDKAARLGADLARLPQVAAVLAGAAPLAQGQQPDGSSVLVASSEVPNDSRWTVFAEQPLSEALRPIQHLLLRLAMLMAFGLLVATIAATLLARHMLGPIRALSAGAHRLGAGDFSGHISVNTGDELEDLAGQFNGMAAQLQESYTRLETKVEERTHDLAQSVNELRTLEEVGRAVASSLDLGAVLGTIATSALAITDADAVLIHDFDPATASFSLIEAKGAAAALAGSVPARLLHEAAKRDAPLMLGDLAAHAGEPEIARALASGFQAMLVVPLSDQSGTLGALVLMRKAGGSYPENMLGLMRTFAHQASLAMRNARLFHEVEQKGNELARANVIVKTQADRLQEQTDKLRDWNKSLEGRVALQLSEIERIRRLERFLAPQVAQLIASSDGHDALLANQRREVTVVFCDLRGFTAFTENSEPEEVMNILREYHRALGELIFRFEGTLDRYAGDGVMVMFNAPLALPDHVERAVRMAVAMRDSMAALTARWRNRGHSLGFGVGIALGYATIGQIGFDRRLEYAAVGSVTNLASRLCDEAEAGQIIVSQRVYGEVAGSVVARAIEPLALKGFARPVPAMEVLGWRDDAPGTFADEGSRPASPA